MAKTGSKLRSKDAAALLIHKKWQALDHITDHMTRAMNAAHYPYVARMSKGTPDMEAALAEFVSWCQEHYAEEV